MSWPATFALPPVALTRPQSTPISVVLPAPLGPSSAKISPRRTLEVDVAQGGESTRIGLRQAADRKDGLHGAGFYDGCVHRLLSSYAITGRLKSMALQEAMRSTVLLPLFIASLLRRVFSRRSRSRCPPPEVAPRARRRRRARHPLLCRTGGGARYACGSRPRGGFRCARLRRHRLHWMCWPKARRRC